MIGLMCARPCDCVGAGMSPYPPDICGAQEKSQKWVKEVLLKEYDSFEFYTGPSFNTEGSLAMMIYEGVPHDSMCMCVCVCVCACLGA